MGSVRDSVALILFFFFFFVSEWIFGLLARLISLRSKRGGLTPFRARSIPSTVTRGSES